jgi:lysyl-tRNA synthetase class 2
MTQPSDRAPWWTPERHADRRPALLARARLATQLRLWFGAQDFLEIDPTALAASPGNEAHLHGFATTAIGNDGAPQTLYLHTSPEFAMKKLLAAGEERIFALTHVWRNRERGPRHHPEFTMLEWYRVGEPYDQLMTDCLQLMQMAATIAGSREFRWGEARCNPFEPPERLGVVEALDRYAGIDLLASIRPDGTTDLAPLAAQARAKGLRVAPDDTWSDLLSALLVTHVEPHLGHGRATILDRYPAAEAALARRLPGDPRLAERFELYACGVELANGFGELTDPVEQRKRFEAEMEEKARVYGERYPLDEDLLAALPLMRPTSGVALGFDRLVMLATHAPRIDEVIWTPLP